ncbi:MAG: hypothetical protein EXR73_00550 [Myxococcales bacterium]|nr:hypothetical protein [Myxococcales bacterium]
MALAALLTPPAQSNPPPPTVAAADAVSANPAEWRVHAAAPIAGERWRLASTVEQRLSAQIRVAGSPLREIEQAVRDEAVWQTELVADDGGLLTATVDYGVCAARVTTLASEQQGASAYDRRRFTVTGSANDSKVLLLEEPVSDANAPRVVFEPPRAVSADLRRRVEQDARETLRGGWLSERLALAPLVARQPFDLPLDLGAQLLADPLRGATLTSFRLTPQSARREGERDAVVLDAEVQAELAPNEADKEVPAVRTTFVLTGELVVGLLDGRLLRAALSGPVRCEGAAEHSGSPIEVAGTGNLTWTYRAEPLAR